LSISYRRKGMPGCYISQEECEKLEKYGCCTAYATVFSAAGSLDVGDTMRVTDGDKFGADVVVVGKHLLAKSENLTSIAQNVLTVALPKKDLWWGDVYYHGENDAGCNFTAGPFFVEALTWEDAKERIKYIFNETYKDVYFICIYDIHQGFAGPRGPFKAKVSK